MAGSDWDPWNPPDDNAPGWWDTLTQKALAIHADGCTKVTQAFKPCCLLHDVLWSLCKTEDEFLTADRLFRRCIQQRSRLGRFSPLSHIRYFGVRTFGRWFFRPRR